MYVRSKLWRRQQPGVYFILGTAWGMGGTIRTVLNLAGYLAQRHDVEIISLMQTRDRPFFDRPPGVNVVALEDRRSDARYGALHRWLRRFPSLFMHQSDYVVRECSLWTDFMLARYLRGRRGFLITTRPGFNLMATHLAPPGLVLIGQEHMSLRSHRGHLRKAILSHYHRLDVLVVLTDSDRKSYAQRLGGRVRLECIPNTVRTLGHQKANLDSKVVITAGRFTHQKGYDMLVCAFAQVVDKHPDWTLRIFGTGKYRTKLERLIAAHELSRAISLEGPTMNLGAEMEAASIFVLSSRYEGMPLVMLEAMSKGLAVVSFDCPTGPGDVIEHRRNGLLVPPADIDGLAHGISELIEDVDLRRRCADAAATAARDYSIERIGPRWDSLLTEYS